MYVEEENCCAKKQYTKIKHIFQFSLSHLSIIQLTTTCLLLLHFIYDLLILLLMEFNWYLSIV